LSEGAGDHLPSWVPDWRASYTHIPFIKKKSLGHSTPTAIYVASGPHSGSAAAIAIHSNRRSLSVHGFPIDTIATIAALSPSSPYASYTDYSTELSWAPPPSSTPYPTGESIAHAYLHTVVADMTYLYNIDRRRGGQMRWEDKELHSTALKCATFGRRFATTRGGYMGLVRKDVAIGD